MSEQPVKMICDHASKCGMASDAECPASVPHECEQHGAADPFFCRAAKDLVRCVPVKSNQNTKGERT